jgi:hypothetical protein
MRGMAGEFGPAEEKGGGGGVPVGEESVIAEKRGIVKGEEGVKDIGEEAPARESMGEPAGEDMAMAEGRLFLFW